MRGSLFFAQEWAIEPSYLLKMQEIVTRPKFERIFSTSEFSNSRTNQGFILSVEQPDEQPNAEAAELKGKKKKDGKSYNVAVIRLHGAMFKRADWLEQSSGMKGTEEIIAEIQAANDDPSISAIVLDVDSPGGTVDGTESIGNAVRNSKKPVVAWVNGMAASAAYWTVSQAAQIIASEENALVGSIGTVFRHVNQKGWLDSQGLEVTDVTADQASDKRTPSDLRSLDEKDMAALKSLANRMNDTFISAVKRGRPEIDESALTGKIYTANQAMSLGMADGIGTLQDAANIAVKLSTENQATMNVNETLVATINTLNAEIEGYRAQLKAMQEETAQAATATAEMQKAQKDLEALRTQHTALAQENARLSAENEGLKKQLDREPEGKPKAVETITDAGKANYDPFKYCVTAKDFELVRQRMAREAAQK